MAKGSTKASTQARKRRKEIIQSSRGADTAPAGDEVEVPMPPLPDAAAAAPLPVKKRRKVSEDNAAAAATYANANADSGKLPEIVPMAVAKKQTKSTKTGKTMNTYEPDVDMTKEQLAAWRREARRVRNRESAAASRRKTKERIEELEGMVDDYKTKYEAALQKLAHYEEGGQEQSASL